MKTAEIQTKDRKVALAGAALFLLAVAAPVFAENTLTLHEQAYVKGPNVYLGEVAEIDGEDADALSQIEITSAALPGSAKNLHAALVSSRLRSAGVDTDTVEIRGARQVRATTLSKTITGETIADSLRSFILLEMPWDPQDAEIDVSIPITEFVTNDGPVEFKWKNNPQYQYLGSGVFRGTVFVNGRQERTLICRANINAYGEVLVAARDIPRGRPVSPADVEVQKRSLDGLPSGVHTRAGDVVGLIARRTIFPGNTLSNRNVEQPLLIKRNRLVPVELNVNGIHIQGRAKALSDARAGDIVRCENLESGAEFQGVVRRDGVVVLP